VSRWAATCRHRRAVLCPPLCPPRSMSLPLALALRLPPCSSMRSPAEEPAEPSPAEEPTEAPGERTTVEGEPDPALEAPPDAVAVGDRIIGLHCATCDTSLADSASAWGYIAYRAQMCSMPGESWGGSDDLMHFL